MITRFVTNIDMAMNTRHYTQDSYKEITVELLKNLPIQYLVHYAAPFTGSGRATLPAGTHFQLTGTMNDYSYYAKLLNNIELIQEIYEKENSQEGRLKGRCTGISFFLTLGTLSSSRVNLINGDINCFTRYEMWEIQPNIFSVEGDVFSYFLCLDARAIFVPSGLTEIRSQAVRLIEKRQGELVHYIPNGEHRIYTLDELRNMVFDALDSLYLQGARRIGMNAIRSKLGSGGSEAAMVGAVMEWIYKRRIADGEVTILLVDKRRGFLTCKYVPELTLFRKRHGFRFDEMYDSKSRFIESLH